MSFLPRAPPSVGEVAAAPPAEEEAEGASFQSRSNRPPPPPVALGAAAGAGAAADETGAFGGAATEVGFALAGVGSERRSTAAAARAGAAEVVGLVAAAGWMRERASVGCLSGVYARASTHCWSTTFV